MMDNFAESSARKIENEIREMNKSALSGLDMNVTTPDYYTGLNNPQAGGAPPATGSIKAYHGSPHKFESFDQSKIGSGAQAQQYGRGFYFAQSEPLARAYRDKLANPEGYMYEVNIRSHPENFFDWNKPISQQSQKVQESVSALTNPKSLFSQIHGETYSPEAIANLGGGAFHSLAQGVYGPSGLSKRFAESGVHGVRYDELGGHGVGRGTSNYVVFDPSIIDVARRYKIGGSVEGYEDGGITAYHGSPHDFDQFDTSKIGTGAGAQSYGHGHYMAEREPVAEGYAGPEGHMYEVHIDAHPDHFLDWDKPFDEQSQHVISSLFNSRKEIPELWKRVKDHINSSEPVGEMYQHIAAGHPLGYQGASDFLHRSGIQGIKFLDNQSSVSSEPKHNYVVFDHNRVKIKRKYEDGGRIGYGFGGDAVGAGSKPERGGSGTVAAARAEAPQQSYRDMPEHLQQAQHDLSARNEAVINAMKESNAADKQRKAEQTTAWANAGFPAGGPSSMMVGDETRPTAYAMSDISKSSPIMKPQAEIIASLVQPAGTPTSGYNPLAMAAGTPTSGYNPVAMAAGTPTSGYNPVAMAAGTPTSGYAPQHFESSVAQNQIAPAPQMAFTQPARPVTETPAAPKPIQLASLDSSTFKPASPMPQPQQPQDRGGGRRRLVKKLMPDGSYQDVWEEYADGGVAKYRSYHHNPAIIEHALGKVAAPPPAFNQTLMVAKRGRPL